MVLIKNLALSDTGFVFNPVTGDSFSVNPIGLGILKDLKEGKPENEILARILEQYDVNPEMVEKDLYDFLKMIRQFNLCEIHD